MWKKCDRYISGWSEIVVARIPWLKNALHISDFLPSRHSLLLSRNEKDAQTDAKLGAVENTSYEKNEAKSVWIFQPVDFQCLRKKKSVDWKLIILGTFYLGTIFVFQGYESNEGYHSHEQKRLSQQCIIAQKELKVGLLSRPAAASLAYF